MRVAVTWHPEYIISEFEISEDDKNQMHNEGVDLTDGWLIDAWLKRQPWFEEQVTDTWNESERSMRPMIEQVEITDDDGYFV